jgi:glycosyltransferase involved in cell wall biosynthesis
VLSEITPMVLTFNEEANIDRTLHQLSWARRILVVDSGSTDGTLAAMKAYPQVDVIRRDFDSAANQCNFGLEHVGTEWVLSLDADYVLSDALIAEIGALRPPSETCGYWARFVYRIYGRSLRGSLYPQRMVLYRRAHAHYVDEGHTQRVRVAGAAATLLAPIYHDDRKPLARWFGSQARYARLEAGYLRGKADKDAFDRLRLMIVPAPLAALLYTLVVRRCLLDGWPGWFYVLQRVCAEVMLSLELLDRRLRARIE